MKFRDERVRGVAEAGVAAAALASIFTSAAAQTIEESATESDEIIEAAQRRDEAIQDVPFSISALGGEEIEALGIPDILIPQLIELHRQGRFPFNKLIRFYPLSEIAEAVAATERGEVLKAVLRP
jgi:Zn-dependent alcohol dehydrogenase